MIPAAAREPVATAAGIQDSMPGRYAKGVQGLSLLAFAYVVFAYANARVFHWFADAEGAVPFWLGQWTEYMVIVLFGVWRTLAERNAYTRKRLAFLTAAVGLFWWFLPEALRLPEPYVGALPGQPIFPQLHTPGTLTFFAVLLLVLLFGRRVICGWNCPCVGVRETVGFAFRDRTPRSETAWRWRHLKWVFFAAYVGVAALILIPGSPHVSLAYRAFLGLIIVPYFATMLLAPLIGNRSYCRFLCPYGATFGLLNRVGFFGLDFDRARCNDCRRCEQVCDMGIPIWEQGKAHGRVVSTEECMGCGRCVISCPTDALAFRDLRNIFKPDLVQHRAHLLKLPPSLPTPRLEPPLRPAGERMADWRAAASDFDLATARAQAARCLDCGVPGCRDACPLGNRIPEWMTALAAGRISQAAEIVHATSPMPEICGALCPQHRLCEGACTKAKDGSGAVTIGALERFVVEAAFAEGWKPSSPAPTSPLGSVAVVGAGPAGLACAAELSKAGIAITVFDRQPRAGGLLAYGVPPFKLDKEVLERRLRRLEDAGVRFELGRGIDGPDLTRLLAEHDAVFLGLGAAKPRDIDVPGRHLAGIGDGLSFLAAIAAGAAEDLRDRDVVILGGGDTAIDCARSAVRLKARSVSVVYRKDAARMRASPKEVAAAAEEGVVFRFNGVPQAFLGQAHVEGVAFASPADGVSEIIPAARVLVAFGFDADTPSWAAAFGMERNRDGLMIADTDGRTNHSKIYAGGDGVHGPDLVVTALAAGRRAAQAMIEDLSARRVRRGVRRGRDGRSASQATLAP